MVILGFAGRIASGKSTIARSISKILGWPYSSFGDCVRAIAEERGISLDRKSLQTLGQSLVNQDCLSFCRRVLEGSGNTNNQSIVVDGIRHVKVVDILKQLVTPNKLIIIFIDTPENIILNRLGEKEIYNIEDLETIEEHSTEAEVKTTLKTIADLIVDGRKQAKDIVDEILLWLQKQK